MTIACGRLEGRITFATAQQVEYADAGGGPVTVTVPAGSYYMTDLCEELETQVQNAGGLIGDGFSCRLSAGEPSTNPTGRVTLACTITSQPFTLTWTSTDLRDALGFTADISVATNSATGTLHAKAVWLPSTLGKFSRHGDSDNGRIVSDFRQTVGPTGTVHGLASSFYRVHDSIRWEGVPAAKAKEHHESTSGESFESFFRAVALGRYSYIPVNTYVRLIWNADVDGTYAVGRLLWPPSLDPEPMILGWTGRYTIALPPLVVET